MTSQVPWGDEAPALSRMRAEGRPRPGGRDGLALPPFLATLVAEEPDDRPVPALGLGDQEAAVALLAATRAVLFARTGAEVISAVARFGLDIGGRLVPAGAEDKGALPLDITLGSGSPVQFAADSLSIARMRLEQFLPTLVEDARAAVSRLRHLEDLETASPTDPLTGLLSRRELMRRLPALVDGDVICLLDVDNFKAVNDRDGHIAGDLLLRDLGRLIKANVRGRDSAGRYGGDEIALLFRAMPEAVAVRRLDQLQELWRDVAPESVTFSAGAAALDGGWAGALANADRAMCLEKTLGRDQSRGHSEEAS